MSVLITKKHALMIMVIVLPILMAPVDLFIAPNYWVKSLFKLILLVAIPITANRYFKWVKLQSFFQLSKKEVLRTIALAVGTYTFIILAYLFFKSVFDFSMVTEQLETSMAITKENFIWVFFYIPLVNALIEESFFRGWGFLALTQYTSRRVSYLLSASVFSLYHVAIMANWFSPVLFVLLASALVIAGLFFNYINEKTHTFLTSYVIHAAANLAINTIGLHLFEII